MSRVIASIREDHTNLAKLLKAVERQLQAFNAGAVPDYDIIRGVIEYCLDYPDRYHHPKEDLILRRLRRRDPAAAEPIGNLEGEHEALSALTRRFAAAVHGVLQDLEVPREDFERVAREFLDRYWTHMRMEEEIFLPAAERVLSAADFREIEAQIASPEDPVFGPAGEQQFQALRRKILRWADEGG